MAGKLNVAGTSLGLDAALGRAAISTRTLYLALLTAAPGVSTTLATMTEYTATGYARQTWTPSTPAGTPRVASNTNGITYGPLTGANGTTAVTHWAIVSASSGTTGDVVAQGDFATSRTPAAGDSLTVAVGAVTVQID